ncbi:MAG: RNA polymerase sporulation-specific sigma factor [Glaciecola sp.]|jgi:RNA polymerase sporulation-specific sigma factor
MVRSSSRGASRKSRRVVSVTPDVATMADEQLVEAARQGDDRAQAALLDRYRRFARAKARSYFLVGGDREDIIQEGMIGLYKAIRDYETGHGASFRSFAELCITRQILTAIKTATRQKHTPLNSYVSFDRPKDADPARTVGDTIADEGNVDPLVLLVASDEVGRLREIFSEIFSELESDVLRLYVEGRSYQEISGLLDRHVKSIDNAIQRIKRKLEVRLEADAAA